jgi:hypothetical protein
MLRKPGEKEDVSCSAAQRGVRNFAAQDIKSG